MKNRNRYILIITLSILLLSILYQVYFQLDEQMNMKHWLELMSIEFLGQIIYNQIKLKI